MKTKQTNQKGFTIIEVLIVMAIAGLILLIVFLAVPALQRNSRNTQRKNDVAALLGSISEFASNNNGALPTTVTAPSAGTVRFGCAAGSCTTSEVKVGYYTTYASLTGTGQGGVQLLAAYAATGPFTTAAADRVVLVTGGSCVTPNTGVTQAGSARQIAAVFENETGPGTYAGACQES